jgi:hypothetical protein
MRVSIKLSRNEGSKTFIELSFRVCNRIEIGSTPLDLVDPERYVRSRECMVRIMVFHTANGLDSENALIREESDTIAFFNSHLPDRFCPIGGLLPE